MSMTCSLSLQTTFSRIHAGGVAIVMLSSTRTVRIFCREQIPAMHQYLCYHVYVRTHRGHHRVVSPSRPPTRADPATPPPMPPKPYPCRPSLIHALLNPTPASPLTRHALLSVAGPRHTTRRSINFFLYTYSNL